MASKPTDQVLVTGAAGFIGFHVAQRLLSQGRSVLGLDNLNSYYDVKLKEARLAQLRDRPGFEFVRMDVSDRPRVQGLFAEHRCPFVVHLAAQAGVRYSIENPHAYIDSNIVGFQNILEGCRHSSVRHLVYASSSSVYGANGKLPFSEHDGVDHPVSLYAATKRANELQAHCYSWLYRLKTTGLRFFTVYGPWGRPDMALFLFTKAILENRPIEIFNNGQMLRDFTYIDDIVEGIVRVLDTPPSEDAKWNPKVNDPATSSAPFRILNIGGNHPVELGQFISAIESCLGIKAIRQYRPIQPGDVVATRADTGDLEATIAYRPKVGIEEGIAQFVQWYRSYFRV
jgi:UDP-glucuronate 4-epimerase